jgi:hypothetical protein
MAIMRHECPVEGHADNFVEISDSWSRRDFRTFWESNDPVQLVDLYQRKTAACNLTPVDPGVPPITKGAQIVEETLDTLDMRVFMWFQAAFLVAANEVQNLGKAEQRRLYSPSATKADEESTMTPTSMPS